MLRHLHHVLNTLLDTRTKKALALTLIYGAAWAIMRHAVPSHDSLIVLLTGSQEAAQQALEIFMERTYWITVALIAAICIEPYSTGLMRWIKTRTRRD